MPTEQPLAALHRRLSLRSEPAADRDRTGDGDHDGDHDGDQNDDHDCAETGWEPGPAPTGQGLLAALRADPGRAGGIALAAVAAVAVLVTVFTLIRSQPPPVVSADLPPVEMAATEVPGPVPAPAEPVVVSVVGLVHQPGLVTLAPRARIADAVEAAGGALDGADTQGLNLARQVADGEQIIVGIAAPSGRLPALGSSVSGQSAGPALAEDPDPGPVDLNTATAGELDALPGLGPVTAEAIVAWRRANGRFTSVDQLAEVDGIGPARLEKLRPLVRV